VLPNLVVKSTVTYYRTHLTHLNLLHLKREAFNCYKEYDTPSASTREGIYCLPKVKGYCTETQAEISDFEISDFEALEPKSLARRPDWPLWEKAIQEELLALLRRNLEYFASELGVNCTRMPSYHTC
jgi:hypothetical protein